MKKKKWKKKLPVDNKDLDDDVDVLQHPSLVQGPVKFLETLPDKYVVLDDFSSEQNMIDPEIYNRLFVQPNYDLSLAPDTGVTQLTIADIRKRYKKDDRKSS